MNDDLKDLYQELILDHGQHPRNHRKIGDATHHAEGFNPLCGDKLHLQLRVEGDRVEEAVFEGRGCAISVAAASTMTEAILGKTRAEAERLADAFHSLVAVESEGEAPAMGKLSAFAGVREFPARVKCATLAWHTLRAALAGKKKLSSS